MADIESYGQPGSLVRARAARPHRKNKNKNKFVHLRHSARHYALRADQ